MICSTDGMMAFSRALETGGGTSGGPKGSPELTMRVLKLRWAKELIGPSRLGLIAPNGIFQP